MAIETPIAVQAAQEARELCNLFAAIEVRTYDFLLRWGAQELDRDVPDSDEVIVDAQHAARPITGAQVHAIKDLAARILQEPSAEEKALINRVRTYRVGG